MNRKEKREKKNEIKALDSIVGIIKQYLPSLVKDIEKVTDKRNKSYVTYEMKVIMIVQILGYVSEQKSMRSMSSNFNTEEMIENIGKILEVDIEELPHYDTINDAIQNVKVDEVLEVIKNIIRHLIRSKILDKFRVMNKFFQIVVDGTGLMSFKEKHCDNCLKRVYKNEDGSIKKIVYYHYVLETKLVVGNMVLSIDSEFVENGKEVLGKQDCEIKAFKRMSVRLKKAFKRLPIIISGDALYACKPVIDICKNNKWEYIIRFKKDRIKTLGENITGLEKISEKESNGERLESRYWNKVHSGKSVRSDLGNEYNVVEHYEYKDKKIIEFIWITSFEVNATNLEKIVKAGRKRWKIENEGFNEQKNGTFDIQHMYSHNTNAMRIHYLLIQIAHIIRQLLEKGMSIIRELKMTKKEVSELIKESLTKQKINCIKILNKIQLRFK